MKKLLLPTLLLIAHLCFSSSVEEDLKMKVEKFLIELNSDTLKLDTAVFAPKYYSLFKKRNHREITKWTLTFKNVSDSNNVIIVSYKRYNQYYGEMNSECGFVFFKIKDQWLITDSYDFLIEEKINFKIEGEKVKGLWDRYKTEEITSITQLLKLEVIEEPIPYEIDKNSIKGKLKLTNNSKYDISEITILIEHFDKNGKSSSTSKKYLFDTIKSGGYKIFDWSTFDCYNCNTRKYKILFYK
jgi:hypothetical protein